MTLVRNSSVAKPGAATTLGEITRKYEDHEFTWQHCVDHNNQLPIPRDRPPEGAIQPLDEVQMIIERAALHTVALLPRRVVSYVSRI
jgi:hypothetical protein